eukprot:scaffold18_cov401-Prasinococcus_capsulatus_cf.AAC.7
MKHLAELAPSPDQYGDVDFDALRSRCLHATPPHLPGAGEACGNWLKRNLLHLLLGWTGGTAAHDLVELTTLPGADTIRLDLRYATTNNFTGHALYEEARCFLRLPCAQALIRAHQGLRKHGYGLLVYDAYRPWSVTALLWEATPSNLREFVANPSRGSLHNRGGAVDVGLYDLCRSVAGAVGSCLPSSHSSH